MWGITLRSTLVLLLATKASCFSFLSSSTLNWNQIKSRGEDSSSASSPRNPIKTRLEALSSAEMDRKRFWQSASFILTTLLSRGDAANARGLLQFPCKEPLGNTYHFMRAGESLLDAEDIWSTNPLFLTNREAALSEVGKEQVRDAARMVREKQVDPTVILYSLAASSMDSADILGYELQLGRDRLVPEYYNLDPRAIGKWDMLTRSTTEPAVWAMDEAEAGIHGLGGWPPSNTDSTPHETLANQATRLRQHLSLLETQFSGDTVLLVFPDGTGPALLSAMIAGIPLNRVHELEYMPGEVRLDVTKASTLDLWHSKTSSSNEYSQILTAGRDELQRLRSLSSDDIVSAKDMKIEGERLEIEAAAQSRELARQKYDNEMRMARKERAQQVEEAWQERRNDNANDALSLTLLAAAGVGTAGVLALATPGAETKTTSPEATIPVGSVGPAVDEAEEPSLAELENDVSVRSLISTAVEDGLREQPAEEVNNDRHATFMTPVAPADREQAAEQAMRDYMDSDDGGDEWLQIMAKLADEVDDEELFP